MSQMSETTPLPTHSAFLPDDVNARDEDGNSLLHHACASGMADLALSAIEQGADVSATNNRGETPLHALAASQTDIFQAVKVVQALITQGAKINAADAKGKTPLDHAIDANHQDFKEKTHLHRQMVRLLLFHGGTTQLAQAQSRCMERRADQQRHTPSSYTYPIGRITAISRKKDASLHLLARTENESALNEIARQIAGGADVNTRLVVQGIDGDARMILQDDAGNVKKPSARTPTAVTMTPLDCAIEAENRPAIHSLIAYGAKTGLMLEASFIGKVSARANRTVRNNGDDRKGTVR